MAAFGFSVGDVIATVELIRKVVGGLRSSTGSAAQYQRTMIELEGLGRVLKEVERLAAHSIEENASRIDSLRATAFAASLTLQDFLRKLRKYEHSLASGSRVNPVGKAARAVQFVMLMDDEVNRLQLYVASQMLSIGTLLQLLERENDQRREVRRVARHQEMMDKLEDQGRTIRNVNDITLPLTQTADKSRKALEALAKNSLQNSRILVDLQQNIIRVSSGNMADNIVLTDALGRTFPLPYAHFNQWEASQLFDRFLTHTFSDITIPGSHQVRKGNFVVSTADAEDKVLTKSNWSSNVYPGARFNMTVILTMLRVQAGQCPRPSCGAPVPPAEIGVFIQCSKCSLVFRYNPDVKLFGISTEEESLQLMQAGEDLNKYGRRHVPTDVVEVTSDDDDEDVTLAAKFSGAHEPRAASVEQTLSSDNLAQLEMTGSKEAGPDFLGPSSESFKLPSIDWNSGESGMVAWLNSSAMPMNEPPCEPKDDAFRAETEKMQQEVRDIAALKRVHFISTVPETQPLKDIVKEFETLPVNVQAHTRRIVDRFPRMPAYLAKRLAKTNVNRETLLRRRLPAEDQ